MTSILIEPLLRKATIQAIDRVAASVGESDFGRAAAVARLLHAWDELDRDEKEQVVATMVAVGSAAITAIVALKARRKPVQKLKKRGKKIVKKVARRLS